MRVLKFPWIKEDVSRHVQTKNHVSGLLRTYVISGASTVGTQSTLPNDSLRKPSACKVNKTFHESSPAFKLNVEERWSPADHRRLLMITAFTSFHTTLFWCYTSEH